LRHPTGHPPPDVVVPNVVKAAEKAGQIQEQILQFYKDVSDQQNVTYHSTVVDMLSNEIRADQVVLTEAPPAYEAGLRPLRLLSIGEWLALFFSRHLLNRTDPVVDGGGVRGVSALRSLKKIMGQVSEAEGRLVHPYEVFDMMAGTSTGGCVPLISAPIQA
jgi:hypothetical protein